MLTSHLVPGRFKTFLYRYVAERPQEQRLFHTLRPKFVSIKIPGEYRPCNPSLCFDGNGYAVVVRSVNYELMESGSVKLHGEGYDTINHIGNLSTDLSVLSMNSLEDAAFRRASGKSGDGFEDLRTFFWKEDLWCLASARSNSDDTNTMALQKISGKRVVESYLIESPFGSSREKNWMPFVSDGKLQAIHTMNPLTIVEISERGTTVSLRKPLKVPKDLLGSSQLVEWKNGLLCVVHERSRGKKHLYKHRFVYFDRNWNVVLSEPFYWKEYGVEFCCGLAVHDGTVAVGFGANDSEAIIAQFSEIDIERLLELS
ncbi:glycoside hydrolase family protein [Paraburkholderia sediminicola]|uniref:hypothetical protein n=1 Tax=Paraburkholderia sediminicola TaxID=458836 RepID=UPI0038BB25B3